MLTWLLLAATLTIDHAPLHCMVKDQFPRIEAGVQPESGVARVRLYFRSAQISADYFFVPMTSRNGRFTARLPKPKEKPGYLSYYIEALAGDGTGQRTAEIKVAVVKDRGSCPSGGRFPAQGPGGDVKVFSTKGSTRKPEAFDGVSSVTSVAATEEGRPALAVPAPGGARPADQEANVPPPEYSIGAGDILRIVVYGHDTLTQTVVVQPDGSFTFPLIGRVQAADMTPSELQKKLTILLAQDYIRQPQVTVNVQEYRSKTVFVVGEITKPGTYPLDANTTVIGILAKAGPTTANAGTEIVIVRPLVQVDGPLLPADVAGEARKATVLRVNLRDIEAGALDKNVLLQPNDTVFIPQAPTVFVTGEVRNPGAFAFKPGATVRQVISLAGGFTERASSRIRVVREAGGKPGKKSEETKIEQDDPVQPGDIIIVKQKLF